MNIKTIIITTALIVLGAYFLPALVLEEERMGAEDLISKTAEEKISEAIEVEKEILIIEKEQEKLTEGKYKHKPEYEKDGLAYEVHEYVTSKGEIGYQIIIKDETTIKSIGYGIESEDRTWEYPIESESITNK